MEHTHRGKGLLSRYASERSDAAFAGLLARHIKLVYSTCLRELEHRELAEEATQAVFIVLARKAQSVRSEAELASWLYSTARYESSALRRKEHTRTMKEQQAAAETFRQSEHAQSDVWRHIEPELNDAISALPTTDQQAILLRFFEEMSLREVAAAMGTNEDAARKRVARALEKLRASLAGRKAAAISAVALAALLTKHAVSAAPAHMVQAIAQSAGAITSFSSPSLTRRGLGGGSGRGGSTLNPLLGKGLLIVSTTKAIAVGSAAIVILLGLIFYAAHRAHSAPVNVVWQAPAAADPATQAVQQQIGQEYDQYAKSIESGDEQGATAIFPPDYAAYDYYTGKKTRDYQEVVHDLSQLVHARTTFEFTVLSCSVAGNTATVDESTRIYSNGRRVGGDESIDTWVNTSGRWMFASERDK